MFTVSTVDKNGFHKQKGGDRVNCFAVNEKTGNIMNPKLIDVFDQNDGKYEVAIKPDESGKYLVYVMINGVFLLQCPYLLHVKPGEPSALHSTLTLLALNPLYCDIPPMIDLQASDLIFFTMNAKDMKGALITEDLRSLEAKNSFRVHFNSVEALESEAQLKVYVTEFQEVKLSIAVFKTMKAQLQI